MLTQNEVNQYITDNHITQIKVGDELIIRGYTLVAGDLIAPMPIALSNNKGEFRI